MQKLCLYPSRVATRFYDRADLRKARLTADGFLRAPVTLSRVGIFHYPGFSVLRRAEEVFSDDTIASYELLPVTDSHPKVNDGAVSPENARQLAVGSVGSVRRDGNFLVGEVLITDAETIKSIQAGRTAVSCGYFADKIEAVPGAKALDPVTGETLPYHFEQVRQRGNHLAIVDAARAGESARIHLDSGDCVEVTTPHKEPQKMKFIIDSIEIDVDPTVAALIAKERAASAALLAAVQGDGVKLKATLDAAEAQRDVAASQIKGLTEKVAALEDPKNIADRINARVAIEKLASEHGITADGLDLIAVKRAVIGKLDPEIKLEGKSNDYVEATFDALNRQPKNVATIAAAKAITGDAKLVPALTTDEKIKAFNAAVFGADASAVKA